MIPIKLQCGCGQRYAFDVEPVAGLMPWAVACPVCGVDGTQAANAVIAQSLPVEAAVAVAEPAMATATSSRSVGRSPLDMRAGQVDRTQAEKEAKARVSWGDPPKTVITYLMSQGFSYQEASAMMKPMYDERASTIRKNGFRKIIGGAVLMCVPVIATFVFLAIGFFLLKIFAVTVMIGLYGAYMVLKGTFMVVAPRFEPGDVAEQ